MDCKTIRTILETACWDADTSADPDNWTPGNRSYGQCAVTALIVQDQLGGTLLRTTVDGVSHYYNRLPGNRCVDLTFDQFPHGSRHDAESVERDRDYVLSHPATAERYELLNGRFEAALAAV